MEGTFRSLKIRRGGGVGAGAGGSALGNQWRNNGTRGPPADSARGPLWPVSEVNSSERGMRSVPSARSANCMGLGAQPPAGPGGQGRSPPFFENLGYFGANLTNSKNDKIRQSKFNA